MKNVAKSRASLCAIAKQRRNSSHINKVKNIARCDPHFGANEKKVRLTRYHLGRVCLAPNTASSQIGTHASKQTQQCTYSLAKKMLQPSSAYTTLTNASLGRVFQKLGAKNPGGGL